LSRTAGVLVAAVVATVLVSALAPAEALASAVRAAELRELAGDARSSPRALAELRRVDRVDGRPADVGAALEGARGASLRRRLDALAAPAVPAAANGASARADARKILSERRFSATEEPRPLAGPIEALGLAVERLLEWIADLLPGLEGDPPPAEGPAPAGGDELSPGGSIVLLLISLPIVALAAVVVVRLLRRRGAAPGGEGSAIGAGPDETQGGDPSALERSAEEAEGRGELARALRLRFSAGLMRLEAARAIEMRPSLTTGEVVRRLRSSTLGELALAFEEVVYGGRAAELGDVAAARAGWPRVLQEVGSA